MSKHVYGIQLLSIGYCKIIVRYKQYLVAFSSFSKSKYYVKYTSFVITYSFK